MNMKEYYDKHIKKEDEGICPECGNDTKFLGSGRGYSVCCSVKCSNKSEKMRKMVSESFKNRDMKKVQEKRKKTCLEKYGVDNYAKTSSFKEQFKETCLERYGVEHNFQTEDCKKKRQEGLSNPEVNEKRKKWWTEENKRNVRNTFLDTLYERYGVTNLSQIESVYEKTRKTQEKNKRWMPLSKKTKYEVYILEVMRITRKNIDYVYEKWDGKCYYSSKELVSNEEYLSRHPDSLLSNNRLQPTIDHKISIKYGFLNSIPPEVIGDIENLCICSRSVNSSKNQLTEEEYYERQKNR